MTKKVIKFLNKWRKNGGFLKLNWENNQEKREKKYNEILKNNRPKKDENREKRGKMAKN